MRAPISSPSTSAAPTCWRASPRRRRANSSSPRVYRPGRWSNRCRCADTRLLQPCTDVNDADDVIMFLQADHRLDVRIVGGGAGFPHHAIAQIVSGEDQVLGGGADGDDLFDLRHLGILANGAADHDDGSRAQDLFTLGGELLRAERGCTA